MCDITALVASSSFACQDALMALTRQDNPTLAVNAFKLYHKWLADGTLPEPFSLAVPGLADRYDFFPSVMPILYR
jgi:hypothetical protein